MTNKELEDEIKRLGKLENPNKSDIEYQGRLISELKGRKEARKELLEEVKEITDGNKIYPKDIFPELDKSELIEINANLLDYYGFPLDRLSAHISRGILKGLNQKFTQETKSEGV
jgi:hypothetical protein